MRVCRWAAVAASVCFAVAAAWELFGPLQAGHWAAMGAEGIAAENMWRFHMFAAVTHYFSDRPSPADYYCHHPYGLFLLQAAAHALFGHHPATVRLVAVACSALSPPLVYVLARELWDDAIVAAVATVAFVVLPIDLCFAGFAGLEVPTMFFGLLYSWATVVLWKRWDRRWLVPAIIGAIGTTQCDWPGIVLVGAVAGFAVIGAYVFPRRGYGSFASERVFRLWLLASVGAAIGCVALYYALFARADQIGRIARIYRFRSGGALAPLSDIFGPRRRMWISWMFTPAGLAVLALALPVGLARLRSRPVEIIPLAWLLTALVQYFVFREGADVHIFWPHYFGVCVALGLGTLVDLMLGVRRRWAARVLAEQRPRFLRWSAVALAVVTALPLLTFARVALPQLRQARLSSGRFDEGGLFIDAEADASQFAQWATYDMPADAVMSRMGSFPAERHVEYSVARPLQTVSRWVGARKPRDPDRIVLLDARRTNADDLRSYARKYDIEAVGPFWRLDRAGHGSFRAMRYAEREPGRLEQYFVVGTDLVRSIGPDLDPWATWEWLDHLGLPAPPPTATPATFDELRAAHNEAIARGDTAGAAALRARVQAFMPQGASADFGNDVHLLATRVLPGPAPVATLLWRAGPAYSRLESSFVVTCRILAPPPMWPSAIDYQDKDMAPPMTFPPALWKPGYLYAQSFVVRHRIGRESCDGAFTTPELRVSSGPEGVHLFTMP